jgi:hypothetical protein
VFSGYDEGLNSCFFKMKVISYLLSSTQPNGQPDIVLVWVTAWAIRNLVVPKKLLIILLHNL